MQTPTLGEVMPFLYREDKPIRTSMDQEGGSWWVLADLCAILEIKNPATVVRRLDEDEYATATIQTATLGAREVTVVSEGGMFGVVLRSNRPEARRLSRYVQHEVLPALWRTGHYNTPEFQWKLDESVMNLSGAMGALGTVADRVAPGPGRDDLLRKAAYAVHCVKEVRALIAEKVDPNYDPDSAALTEAIDRR